MNYLFFLYVGQVFFVFFFFLRRDSERTSILYYVCASARKEKYKKHTKGKGTAAQDDGRQARWQAADAVLSRHAPIIMQTTSQ